MAGRRQPQAATSRIHNSSTSSSSSSSYPSFANSRAYNNQSSRKSSQTTPNNPTKTNNYYNNRKTGRDLVEDGRNPPPLVGTCPFMCPVKEREVRERLRDLALFERLDGNPRKTSPDLAVKKFCRTISTYDVRPSDIRPPSVLETTLDHLFGFLQCDKHPFEVVHEFIFDRTRSIRQDISMQNLISNEVISMYERMVKYHVLSHHKLRTSSSNPNISSIRHLNMEQLTKALSTLFNLYDAARTSESTYENESEFHSIYVLLHLGSESSENRGESLSLWFRHVPYHVLKSKELCLARSLLRYFSMGNYKRFISMVEVEASFLQYCVLEPYISEVRAMAVSCINHGGYKLQPFPLEDLSKTLMMKEEDADSFCNDCGLQTITDEVGRRFLPVKQTNFCKPKRGLEKNYPLNSERFESIAFEL